MTIQGINGINQSGQRVERTFDKEGKLSKESIFMDVNGDGKEDLYQITKYYRNTDGSYSVDVFIDRDGDGYNDYHKNTQYNEFNKRTGEFEIEEEDINAVKKRKHLEAEVYNRQMDVLNGDYLMMRVLPSSSEPIHYDY